MKKYLSFLLLAYIPMVMAQSNNLISVQTKQTNNSIALTLDACGGATDWKILHYLVENKIPATIFVTKKWIDGNQEAVTYLKENKNIFKIENHGEEHKEAVFKEYGAYHLKGIVNQEGLTKEVEEGAKAIEKNFGVKPTWYRDAGALYDQASLTWLKDNQWKVGGYTIAGDEGATASTSRIIQIMSKVKTNDVILMHMNKPHGHTYEGLVNTIPTLLNKGYQFKWLED